MSGSAYQHIFAGDCRSAVVRAWSPAAFWPLPWCPSMTRNDRLYGGWFSARINAYAMQRPHDRLSQCTATCPLVNSVFLFISLSLSPYLSISPSFSSSLEDLRGLRGYLCESGVCQAKRVDSRAFSDSASAFDRPTLQFSQVTLSYSSSPLFLLFFLFF